MAKKLISRPKCKAGDIETQLSHFQPFPVKSLPSGLLVTLETQSSPCFVSFPLEGMWANLKCLISRVDKAYLNHPLPAACLSRPAMAF